MQTYQTPFSIRYWKDAAAELHNTRHIVLAALLIAMRVAVRSVSIPISQDLYVSIAFLPNALGSLIYGPVMALIVGAVSDVLGSLLFPKGPFFFPFTWVEMLGSLLFALFLYKAPLKIWRVACSKLLVNFFCNILLTPLFLAWMYSRAAVLYDLPRIIKNIVLFPLEVFLLVVLLNSLLPHLARLHIIPSGQTSLAWNARHTLLLIALFAVSVVAVYFYVRYGLPIINPNPTP